LEFPNCLAIIIINYTPAIRVREASPLFFIKRGFLCIVFLEVSLPTWPAVAARRWASLASRWIAAQRALVWRFGSLRRFLRIGDFQPARFEATWMATPCSTLRFAQALSSV
jgi:hypothetical protein